MKGDRGDGERKGEEEEGEKGKRFAGGGMARNRGERKSGLMVSRKGGERGKHYAGGGSYDREDFEVG